MPKTHRFSLQHRLPNHREMIYTTLLDFKKFGEIHPYMKEVTIISDNSPEFINYQVMEEIYLLGLIKNYPTYTAKVLEIEKNKHIRYLSPVKPFIFLQIDFTFSEKNGNLIVHENFELTCNRFWAFIFLNILKKAHLDFFERLRQFLL